MELYIIIVLLIVANLVAVWDAHRVRKKMRELEAPERELKAKASECARLDAALCEERTQGFGNYKALQDKLILAEEEFRNMRGRHEAARAANLKYIAQPESELETLRELRRGDKA